MNNQEIVAKALYEIVKEQLSLEQIQQLLENPKSADHGDVAFPTFSLAKVFRKAPQQIATDRSAPGWPRWSVRYRWGGRTRAR